MKITYKDGQIQSMNIEINGYGDSIDIEKDQEYGESTTKMKITYKAKPKFNDKNVKLSFDSLETFMRLLSRTANKDTIDMLEKNVYVLPFASKAMRELIDNLKNMEEFIKIS